jgi:hypothetical protein
MANIFSKKDQYIDRVNRSTFDLSFVNNFTTNFGVITPVCLLPVGFGDSVQINAKFNLQLMPTVFPIQTQMYARLHFVYVRTRTIWEDWQKFFGGDETVVPPYINFNTQSRLDAMAQTSTLGDYLNLPTTVVGKYGQYSPYSAFSAKQWSYSQPNAAIAIALNTIPMDTADPAVLEAALNDKYQSVAQSAPRGDEGIYNTTYNWYAFFTTATGMPARPAEGQDNSYEFAFTVDFANSSGGMTATIFQSSAFFVFAQYDGTMVVRKLTDVSSVVPNGQSATWSVVIPFSDVTGDYIRSVALIYPANNGNDYVTFPSSVTYANPWRTNFSFSGFLQLVSVTKEGRLTLDNCPYYDGSTSSKSIRVSALPFRVYEAYYNAFHEVQISRRLTNTDFQETLQRIYITKIRNRYTRSGHTNKITNHVSRSLRRFHLKSSNSITVFGSFQLSGISNTIRITKCSCTKRRDTYKRSNASLRRLQSSGICIRFPISIMQ